MNIILTGLARSGKDTVADYLAQKYGYRKYVLSDILAELLRGAGKEATKPNMAMLGDELREKEGMEAVGRRLMDKIKERDRVVIVGARSMEEVDFIKRKLNGAILVRVNSLAGERFKRRSYNDPNTAEEFFERDDIDLKNKGFEKVLKNADFILENNSTLWELHKKIDDFIEKFK